MARTIQVVLELVYDENSTMTPERRAELDIKGMVRDNRHGYAKKVTMTRLERLTTADQRLGNIRKDV